MEFWIGKHQIWKTKRREGENILYRESDLESEVGILLPKGSEVPQLGKEINPT